MGLFDSIYRLYGTDDIDPETQGMSEVPIGMDEMAQPPVQPRGPRMIPPRNPIPRPGFNAYLEHIRNMPTQEDFNPSLGRKIGAGLVGFATGLNNPAAGYAASEQILRSPYNRALEEWSAKGGALKNLAAEEGDFAGNMMDYDVEGGKLDARYAELKTREDQIKKNYEIASKNATTAEAKVQAQKDRDAAMQTILEERNKIDRQEAGTKQFEAQTGRQRADAYGRYVDAYGQFGGGAQKDITPKVDELMKAEQDVLLELLATDQTASKFFKYNQDTGGIDPVFDESTMTPEAQYEREALMMKVGVEAQKRLGGEAVGGVPPLWRMRPKVVVPPNRRRMP